jgi:hypothetical protein
MDISGKGEIGGREKRELFYKRHVPIGQNRPSLGKQ